jgi:hypothetical protein
MNKKTFLMILLGLFILLSSNLILATCPNPVTQQYWNPDATALDICSYCINGDCSYCGDGKRNLNKYGAMIYLGYVGVTSSSCPMSDCINGWEYFCVCQGSGCNNPYISDVDDDVFSNTKQAATAWYSMKRKCDSCDSYGVCQDAYVEYCDDGNKNNYDGCSSTCQLEKCYDGVIDTGEFCDKNTVQCTTLGYDYGTATCKNNCLEFNEQYCGYCYGYSNPDLNGRMDYCTNSECSTSPWCKEKYCNNGRDDDGDGKVDCADPDCYNIACNCITPPPCTCKVGSVSYEIGQTENCQLLDSNFLSTANAICKADTNNKCGWDVDDCEKEIIPCTCEDINSNFHVIGEEVSCNLVNSTYYSTANAECTAVNNICDWEETNCDYYQDTCKDTPASSSIYVNERTDYTVNSNPYTKYDICDDRTTYTLRERFCDGTKLQENIIDCDYDCIDGACKCGCTGGLLCNYQRTGYTGSENIPEPNDFPTRIDNVDVGACCRTSTECVKLVMDEAECTYSMDKLTFNNENFICDKGMWVDPDSTPQTCTAAGFKWAMGGIANKNLNYVSAVSTKGTIEVYVGEYNELNEQECCGDDSYEHLVTKDCDGTTISVCCPDNTYSVNLEDGVYKCQKICPHKEKSARVLLDSPSTKSIQDGLDAYLKSKDRTLGCVGTNCPKMAIYNPAVNVEVPTPKEYCQIEDPVCVYKSNQDLGKCENTSMCIKSSTCQESANLISDKTKENLILFDTNSNTNLGSVYYNNDQFTIKSKNLGCFNIPTLNCMPSKECVKSEITEIKSDFCFPACLSNVFDISGCFIACKDAQPVIHNYYDGANCKFTNRLTGKSCLLTDFTRVCINDYEITEYNSDIVNIISQNTKASDPLEKLSSLSAYCSEKEFCKDLGCVQENLCLTPTVKNVKNEIVDLYLEVENFNGVKYTNVSCDKDPSSPTSQNIVTLGDYWCPPNFEYFYDEYYGESYCKEQFDICDRGFINNGALQTDFGCNNLLTQTDYWKLYNNACMYNETPKIYNEACCLDSVLNGFYIYTTEESIKVY